LALIGASSPEIQTKTIHGSHTATTDNTFSALQSRKYGSQSSENSSHYSGYYSYTSSQEEVTPIKKPKTNTYKGPLEEGTLEIRPPFEQVKVRVSWL
jgi:hypothetical protein